MAGYLLISSEDPFDNQDTRRFHQLAGALSKSDGPVTLFLVQNGVLSARAGDHARGLAELAQAGVDVVADDFSLRERGISASRLAPHVRAESIDLVLDQLAEGRKVLWH